MSDKNFEIYDLRVNQIAEALGLDVEKPVFSWKLKSEKQNTMQTKAQILVGKTAGGVDVWDSGEMSTDNSAGITFDGDVLQPETRYYVTVRVWNQDEEEAETSSWFETGLMNGSISAWDGAKWIGAPEFNVASEKLGVFVLESTFRIKKGTKAPQAAGKIHTDFERGFIKAEVVNYQDLLDNGSLSAAKEKGIVGMEGKDYVVKDGDVILFRFNV